MSMGVVPVRIKRGGVYQNVDLHTLTDAELEAFAKDAHPDPMDGWRWARRLAEMLVSGPITVDERGRAIMVADAATLETLARELRAFNNETSAPLTRPGVCYECGGPHAVDDVTLCRCPCHSQPKAT